MSAVSSILLADPGGYNARRIRTADLSRGWAVSEAGILSGFAVSADVRGTLLSDFRGKWIACAGGQEGPWNGVITAAPLKPGGRDITAETHHCQLKSRLTPRSNHRDSAPAGALWVNMLSTLQFGEDPLWFASYGADEHTDPMPWEWRLEDAYEATLSLAQEGGMEWHVDADRNAAMRERVGSDLSATVHLVGKHHVVDYELPEDLWVVANEVVGVAGDADFERAQTVTVADPDSIATFGRRYQTALVAPNAVDRSTIEPLARAELNRRKDGHGPFDITIVNEGRVYSRFREGDSIRVTVGKPALTVKARVMARTLEPNGAMAVSGYVEAVLAR